MKIDLSGYKDENFGMTYEQAIDNEFRASQAFEDSH